MTSVFETIRVLEGLVAQGGPTGTPRLSDVHTSFLAPSLHIDAVSAVFSGLEDEARLDLLQEWIDEATPQDDRRVQLANLMVRLPVVVDPLTPEEAEAKRSRGEKRSKATWVASFLDRAPRRPLSAEDIQKYVHFYGYKGGQGRSTVLGLLAKALADDGYRVLLVDADIEAPSLDLLFGVSADSFDQTLMGLCGWADTVRPIAGAHAGRSGGQVDLLPCRPRVDAADLDFALLVASAPLDARVYEWAAQRLQDQLLQGAMSYDVVMVDHRTGIASSVLPLMSRLPGSAAVFARTDFNTAKVPSELRRVVRSIFAATTAIPGAFVGFSLDPQRSASSTQSPLEARVREQLLGELATAMTADQSADEQSAGDLSASELSYNWVDWYVDRALLEPMLPDVQKLQSDNISSIGRLRETLGLPIGRRPESVASQVAPQNRAPATSSLSGAKDTGQFIHIPEVESLFVRGNPYTYVLGRKGTGKTRLLREMVSRGLGTPLLVASDETESGAGALRSLSVETTGWVERCGFDARVFWWSLLRLALEHATTNQSLENRIRHHLTSDTDPKSLADPIAAKEALIRHSSQQVLLVDGLETLVPAASIRSFVSALFNMVGTIQNDPALSNRLIIRSFVREDLATDLVQNSEQQMEGRLLRLKWSAASVLNFAVSRLPTLPWIRSQFPSVCEEIVERADEVAKGALSEQEATALMLRVFPARLRRNNLSTATFLRLYFSDAGGDDTNKATFYPRLYLTFLQKLDQLASSSTDQFDEHKTRIASGLLNRAYDEASSEFINETKQELTYLLSLEHDDSNADADSSDSANVTKFIAAFDGLSTPFEHEALVVQLRQRTHFKEKSIRDSLQRMKAIRMFEDRPGYGGWWRVGQLYKMGLRMKYVRG